MKGVRFWGTRGSLPVSLTADDLRRRLVTAVTRASGKTFTTKPEVEAFVDDLGFAIAGTYGGRTSCVELMPGGDEFVLCDLGSGVRSFGRAVFERHGSINPHVYHVFLSHAHWDHIMGLPFFAPAFVPGNRIHIYGGHPDLEAALRRQQEPPSYPVDFASMRADFDFVHLEPERRYEIAGMAVTALRQPHPGDSYGYRFESGGRSVVYSTDSAHDPSDTDAASLFVEFFRDADLVIFDAMYSLAEETSTDSDWGHSNNIAGVELCQAAGVRHLCLFHHKPDADDTTLANMLDETRQLEELTRSGQALQISVAYDGLTIPL